MNRLTKRIILITILQVVVPSLFATFAKSATIKKVTSKANGWMLDANSNFAGTIACKFTEDATLMHLDKMGLTMLARAPKWEVTLYNDVNKSYLTMPYDKWQLRFKSTVSKHTPSTAFVDLPVETIHNAQKILGFATDKYTLKRKVQATGAINKTECWVANDVEVPSHFVGIMHTLFQTPENIKGMPLRVEMTANGRQTPVIEVNKLVPKTFAKDEFKSLTGFKKVENELALMLDDSDDMSSALLGPDEKKKVP